MTDRQFRYLSFDVAWGTAWVLVALHSWFAVMFFCACLFELRRIGKLAKKEAP